MAVIYNRRAFIVFASFLPMWDFYFYIFEAIWQRFDQAPGGLKVRRVHTGVNSAKHILVVIYRLVERAAVIFGIKICSKNKILGLFLQVDAKFHWTVNFT